MTDHITNIFTIVVILLGAVGISLIVYMYLHRKPRYEFYKVAHPSFKGPYTLYVHMSSGHISLGQYHEGLENAKVCLMLRQYREKYDLVGYEIHPNKLRTFKP